ncbi:hypothetical protein LR48_Vigan05g106800 [Vigna angularis]|uniref:Uncharacterized protein n=1 Tax=Phaseolus angularis TaxID=3914 RepID=A0A0L9ULP9_PHAAN|nr:hypothetical protein LR48_Vigan05g106800 [Vigna angularis]
MALKRQTENSTTSLVLSGESGAQRRIRIGYYHRLGERHVQCQKDQINMPGRFSPANERLPSKSGRSSSESGRSPSERTLVQRVDARRPMTLVPPRTSKWTFAQRTDARPAKNQQVDVRPANGRSSSEWTLIAQRTNVRRPARTLVQRTVDVRHASARP